VRGFIGGLEVEANGNGKKRIRRTAAPGAKPVHVRAAPSAPKTGLDRGCQASEEPAGQPRMIVKDDAGERFQAPNGALNLFRDGALRPHGRSVANPRCGDNEMSGP
jgi:hypothetical protein